MISSFFAASYNFCMRRSLGALHSTKSFLMIELWVASFCSIMIHPLRTGILYWNEPILYFGGAVGLVFGAMLYFLGRAMEYGPSGLTIAGLNASNVLPSIVMFLFFGPSLGFGYTRFHLAGSLLVLIGILWASSHVGKKEHKIAWALYASMAFFLHVLFLVAMQWRALMIQLPDYSTAFRVLPQQLAANPWFTPSMYMSAAILHTVIFIRSGKRSLSPFDWKIGIMGGGLNALYAFFLVVSAEKASLFEHTMLFPLFSVITIFLCNLWGKWFYQEKVHWKACHLSFLGIVIGTVDWASLSEFLQMYLM